MTATDQSADRLRQLALGRTKTALDEIPVTTAIEAQLALEGAVLAVMYRSFETRTHHALRKFFNEIFREERKEGMVK
jgi:hypothetical protein